MDGDLITVGGIPIMVDIMVRHSMEDIMVRHSMGVITTQIITTVTETTLHTIGAEEIQIT